MKLKKIAQLMLITCSIVALGACSTGKKNNGYGGSSSAMTDMNGGDAGAQASGIGQDQGFGDQGGSSGSMSKNTYYFAFDSSDVQQSDMPSINANANYLMSHANARITIEGHTDPRGSREYNVALGERRADAVLDIMKSQGVNPNQIRVVSYGAERLAAPGRDEQSYQLDRRAVIVYTQR